MLPTEMYDGIGSWSNGRKRGAVSVKPWSSVCTITCLIQMGGGVLMMLLSMRFLFGHLLTTGMIIGALLLGMGAVGLIGVMKKNRDFLNFHLVGALLAVMLSFQFMGQVWRDVEVDCALAELYVKGSAVEDITKAVAHQEMFDTVYQRINEVEDMMSMVHSGIVQTFMMFDHDPTHPESIQQMEFIKGKLELLKKHAMAALDETTNANITDVSHWKEEDKSVLRDKLVNVDKVLRRIDEFENDNSKTINADEYEELLKAVTGAFLAPVHPNDKNDKDTTALAQEFEELEKSKGPFNRMAASLSTLEQMNNRHINLSQEIQKRRSDFNMEFTNKLRAARDHNSKSFHAEALADLPEHCIVENEGMEYMGRAGLIVAIAQLVSVYCVLCLQFRLPVKVE